MAESTRWITPANVIAVAGIAVGASVGVAVGNPAGQEFMCGLAEAFCADVAIDGPVAWIDGFDLEGWCAAQPEPFASGPDGEPPPPGFTPGLCGADMRTIDDREVWLTTLEAASREPARFLSVALSFTHDPIREPKPFTIRLQCGRIPPSSDLLVQTPCAFTTTWVGDAADPFAPEEPVEPVLKDALLPDADQVFARRWGLEIGGATTTAGLEPGRYQVRVMIADQPDRVARADAVATFQITP